GIRDFHVTGVQTCALPISFNGFEAGIAYSPQPSAAKVKVKELSLSYNYIDASLRQAEGQESRYALNALKHQLIGGLQLQGWKKRSEERRVGKECIAEWSWA